MSETHDAPFAEAAVNAPRARRPRLGWLVLLVAIAVVATAAWFAWQLRADLRAGDAAREQDSAAIASLMTQLGERGEQAQALARRVGNVEAALDDAHAANQALARRLANLETAYALLSGQQRSGRDTLLLNDAELLLRSGQQRFELFHDGEGALKAYAQAIEVLAQVRNPAYTPVRSSAQTEREALAVAAPPFRQHALDVLTHARGQVTSLPRLAATTTASAPPQARHGVLPWLGKAFNGIVSVTHEGGKETPMPEARFAMQALALDLAQAQEALLAFDAAGYRGALQQARSLLASQFDGKNSDVARILAELAALLAQPATGPAPTLGGALAQLQSLRASQFPPPNPDPDPPNSHGATKR